MVRWIIILIVLFLAYRLFRRFLGPKAPAVKHPPQQIQDEMVQDPVCQTYVPKRLALTVQRPGDGPLYFCSPDCRDQYLSRNEKEREKEKVKP
jgi:YHS domain-containing protein